MQSITNEDKKLLKKFERMIKSNFTENETLDFWSKLNAEEYDRLGYLFEQDEIDGIPENIRLKLIKFFKKVREKYFEANK